MAIGSVGAVNPSIRTEEYRLMQQNLEKNRNSPDTPTGTVNDVKKGVKATTDAVLSAAEEQKVMERNLERYRQEVQRIEQGKAIDSTRVLGTFVNTYA